MILDRISGWTDLNTYERKCLMEMLKKEPQVFLEVEDDKIKNEVMYDAFATDKTTNSIEALSKAYSECGPRFDLDPALYQSLPMRTHVKGLAFHGLEIIRRIFARDRKVESHVIENVKVALQGSYIGTYYIADAMENYFLNGLPDAQKKYLIDAVIERYHRI